MTLFGSVLINQNQDLRLDLLRVERGYASLPYRIAQGTKLVV
jgi:hypothetical protein